MNYFKKWNNIAGWVVFAASLIVYVLTAEPTASWWDCMEFTATAYKLEVGHPPGAPLSMMVMRLFTMLSFGHPEWVGFASNLMSCVMSAFCILFMFWTITHLARKMYGTAFDGANKTQVWTALGAGIIGALAYAFTDSFWFSAVESEVYAFSSMLTALVVWLMMKWEPVADQPGANRWLILIAYIMGLSIGVHILNLLTIPALVFIYYFHKTERVTWKGVLLALAASGGILAAIYVVIMPFTVIIGAAFDRLFVNSFGMPVNSGMAVWMLLLFALIGLGVWLTHRAGKVVWNTVLLCVGVILIGYSSYASVVIRSAVNPPMNSNKPDNPYGLQSLLNRDQFGKNPIFYGPAYSSLPTEGKYEPQYFVNDEGRYEKKEVLTDYEYPAEMQFFFPRMWSYGNAKDYEAWMGDIKTKTVRYGGETAKVPTFGEHLRYFFGFQFNYMYWRYFMWNFVGRQNDIQGRGGITDGGWLSGIPFIDALYLGPQKNLPAEMERNKGRNTFFFLPFLLGLLGMIAQLGKDRRGFVTVMWLFIMMGVALVVYFNIPGLAVRERDYIYAGSFYAFSIWIGLGVVWIQEIIQKFFKRECWVSAAVATFVCAVVPGLLIGYGWDDHDRSGRSIGHDLGYNDLISTLPNSIIMNFGDNDAFPLWYNQEVENVRPDVRIMNMSYLSADWYIEQMEHAYNESAPVPFTIPRAVYSQNDMLMVDERVDRPLDAKWVVDFVISRDRKTQGLLTDGSYTDYIPTRKIALPVDKEAAVRSGIIRAEDAGAAVDTIYFNLPEKYLDRTQFMLLDLLANFDWKRPLYFTETKTMRDMGLGDWLQSDGWVYRFVPIETKFDMLSGVGRIDTEYTYDLLMNKYKYGGAGDPGVYVDYTSVNNLSFVRAYEKFARLARQLVEEGDPERAVEVLDRALTEYPTSKINFDFYNIYPIIEAYYYAGAMEQGDRLLENSANTLQEYIEYWLQFDGRKADLVYPEWAQKFRDLEDLLVVAKYYKREDQAAAISEYLELFEPVE